jgi:hypothetical protein
MQSKTGSVVETFTTIIRDNIGNACGIYVAKKWFGIDISIGLQIAIGLQIYNAVGTYIQRRIFNKYGESIVLFTTKVFEAIVLYTTKVFNFAKPKKD